MALPKAVLSDAIPDIDLLEGTANDDGDEYSILKRYQRQLEYDLCLVYCLGLVLTCFQIHTASGRIHQG